MATVAKAVAIADGPRLVKATIMAYGGQGQERAIGRPRSHRVNDENMDFRVTCQQFVSGKEMQDSNSVAITLAKFGSEKSCID